MLQFASRAFPWIAAFIALTFAWIGVDELQYGSAHRSHQLRSVLFAFGVSVLFGVAAVSAWLRWRILRPAAVVCGGGAAFFAISMLAQGWEGEDASGVLGPILLGAAVITATLGVAVGIKGNPLTPPPNTSLERTCGK